MQKRPNNTIIASGLFFAVFIWGANNAAAKFVLRDWPPNFTGSTRFLSAGFLMLALLRWTKLFGPSHSISPDLNRRLWWRGGLSLAGYIMMFNWALTLIPLSHVALYLGASPVWALLAEGRPKKSWPSAQRYGAAALAFCGVIALFWPALHSSTGNLKGELIGFVCGPLWTNFGNQCRDLGRDLTGSEVSAHTFWRAGVLLLPLAIVELLTKSVPVHADLIVAQFVCVLGGSIVAFAIWNSALRYWPTSRVYLFNNLVPLSSTAWAFFCLGEPLSPTFWPAMLLIAAGVFLGQARWGKFLAA